MSNPSDEINTEEALSSIASVSCHIGPIEELSPALSAIIKFSKSQFSGKAVTQGTLAFLIVEGDPREALGPMCGERYSRFLSDPAFLPTDGCYVTGLSAAHAWSVMPSFVTIEDIVLKTESVGLNKYPCVFIDYDNSLIQIYADGLSGETPPVEIEFETNVLSLKICQDILRKFEDSVLPNYRNKELWIKFNKNEWVSVHRLEKQIQERLIPILYAKLDEEVCTISEATTAEGICDLLLLSKKDPGILLELKALREKSANSETPDKKTSYGDTAHKKSVQEGIYQGISYRKKSGVETVILAVFIACRDRRKVIYDEYKPKCDDANIELEWLQMYPNHRIKREMEDNPVIS